MTDNWVWAHRELLDAPRDSVRKNSYVVFCAKALAMGSRCLSAPLELNAGARGIQQAGYLGRRRATMDTRTRLSLLLALGMSLAGCAVDHRISLDEFLKMERTSLAIEVEREAEASSASFDLEQYMGAYRVGPGDVLSVVLTGNQEGGLVPALQARIDRQGQIDLPIVGAVSVIDLELEDVEDVIRSAYVPSVFNAAIVHVEAVDVHTTNVLVVGAVRSPGLVPLQRNQRNMLFAIVGADGASDLASGLATLRRIRRPEEPLTLDLRNPLQLQQALATTPLEQGDIINVHAAQPNTVFVGGLVSRAGPQAYPPGTKVTVLQAIAAAGGLRTDIYPKEGTLVRRREDGSDVHVKLPLDQLAMGQAPNLALNAGDILWVPHTWATRVQEFINRNVFLRAGVSVNYNVTGIEFLNRRSSQSRRAGATQQDQFDPLGFLSRNAALQGIQGSLP